MKTTMESKLTGDQRNSLHLFAWLNGRRWKQALRDEWMRACSGVPLESDGIQIRATLQGLRNSANFGTRGLAAYRLPMGFAFKGRN